MTGGGKGGRSQAHVILRTPTQYITDYIARVKGFPGGTLWLFMVVPPRETLTLTNGDLTLWAGSRE
jgi:hypothetical protein